MPTLSSLFGPSKNKLLLRAARYGNVDKVQELLDKGANIEATAFGYYERTPLHHACWYGRVKVVEMLLERRANIEATTTLGETPLHYACSHGHVEVVEMLLNKGPALKQQINMERLRCIMLALLGMLSW